VPALVSSKICLTCFIAGLVRNRGFVTATWLWDFSMLCIDDLILQFSWHHLISGRRHQEKIEIMHNWFMLHKMRVSESRTPCHRQCMSVAGCAISDFGARGRVMLVSAGATVTMVACIFMSNTVVAEQWDLTGESTNSTAILEVASGYAEQNNPKQVTIVRMKLCTFAGTNSADSFVMIKNDGFSGAHISYLYSDDADLEVFFIAEGIWGPPELLSEAPADRKGLASPSLRLLQVCSFSRKALLTTRPVAAVQMQNHAVAHPPEAGFERIEW
jgi:hypothetical protein